MLFRSVRSSDVAFRSTNVRQGLRQTYSPPPKCEAFLENDMIGLIIIFITLIILYLGVILFVETTFVKISLFAMDKLAVFIASWYYTHHYFSVKFSSGYAIYFWDVLAAILAVVIYSVLFQFIHKRFNLLGKLLNLAISFFSSMTVYCILTTDRKSVV